MLITGGSGALGTSLKKAFKDAFFPTHKEMNVADADSVDKAVLKYRPEILIHTAALVGIRECEEDKEKASLKANERDPKYRKCIKKTE